MTGGRGLQGGVPVLSLSKKRGKRDIPSKAVSKKNIKDGRSD